MTATISEEQLKRILTEDFLSVTLLDKGGEIAVEPSLSFTPDNGELTCYGYTAIFNGEELEFSDFSALKKFLSAQGAVEEGYRLKDIDGGKFRTVEELEAKRAFDKITMTELLEKYSEADRFTLTGGYMKGVDRKHPYGTVGISDENAAHALDEITRWAYNTAKDSFNYIPEEERAKLPQFDALYAEIDSECRQFRAKHAAKIKRQNGNAFFCDEFSMGKCKYKVPDYLWHVYFAVDFKEECAYTLNELKKLPPPERLDELTNFPELQAALIGAEATFTWHCTTGGLSTVFTFALNEQTREWLLRHKDDYDFGEGLEDLALYQGDKILFSSCTHERFHEDCRQQGEE